MQVLPNDGQFRNRAFAAWFRANGESADIPSSSSYLCVHDGKYYMVLVNVNGILGVYRVRTDDSLKALKRWPKEIEMEA